MTNIVDSHCHLDFKDFNSDLDKVVRTANQANVKHMLSISVNMEDFDQVYKVTSSLKIYILQLFIQIMYLNPALTKIYFLIN